MRSSKKKKEKSKKQSNVAFKYLTVFVLCLAVLFYFYRVRDVTGESVTGGVVVRDRDVLNVTTLADQIDKTSSRFAYGILNSFSDQHNSEFLWGPYRPQLYYGMRTRIGDDSLIFGFMWFAPGINPYHIQLRHVAKTEDDVIIKWVYNNGRDFAQQVINDTRLGIIFNITLVKTPGIYGGDWVTRISADHTNQSDKKIGKISLMFYLGVDKLRKGYIQLDTSKPGAQKPLSGTTRISGHTESTGDFSFIMPFSKGSRKEKESTYYSGVQIDEVWTIEKNLRLLVPKNSNRAVAQLENVVHDNTNVLVLQKIKKIPFEVDLVFLSDTTKYPTKAALVSEANSLSSKHFDNRVAESIKDFDEKFENTFHLAAKGFSVEHIEFAKTTFSNLLGGIGFFNGKNRIFVNNTDNYEPNYVFSKETHSLFTATPSRKFFPRGFLWDEGFHQLLISAWDKELSKDMISSWLYLTDENGWIPREQILGSEAESRVPAQFVVQYPDHANPPTLYLAIEKIIELESYSSEDIEFLRNAYKHLTSNYVWFLKTQKGETVNSFRWRGSSGKHTLASGLDDYPRTTERTINEEHLDLLCWVTLSSNLLDKIAKSLDIYDVPYFKTIENELRNQIFERHWNQKSKVFCDLDGKTGKFFEHIGYNSLFPFLFGLVPVDSPYLDSTLHILESSEHLFTDYGLRSLSASDPFYRTGEDYWRGPIWINMNYLVLRSLYKYYSFGEGEYSARARALYVTLRKNLINNIYKGYVEQSDIFEQYDPTTGQGKGQHPFTGWSSLVILIMAEKY